MIRRLLDRVFRKGAARAPAAGPRIIPRKQHGISRDQLTPCALKTVTGLQQAGFVAFVVGGAVRDLLLGKHPKDFDVATDATPEEVRNVFRRSRIIGRRFRLVHVMCGNETIEVSTFRGVSGGDAGEATEEDEYEAKHSKTSKVTNENGRILRDNVFGTQEQDAERRDFTANALYYDPTTEEVWDYQNGFADVKARVLRMIGDPDTRYHEDPVRMLRAVRLAAKLDFHIDETTREPVSRLADLLQDVPPSRLFDEMLKLLFSGHALRGVHQLRAEGLHHGLLPVLDTILEQPQGERFVTLALKNTDERVQADKPVSPAFLFASLLWHEVAAAWQRIQAQGIKPLPALFEAMDQVLDAQRQKLAIPRRYDGNIQEIWSMQPRFQSRAGQRPFKLLEHPRFRAAFDFLVLRAQSGEIDMELANWWEEFQHAGDARRGEMLVADTEPKKRRRKRGPRKPAASAAPEQAE